METNIGKIRKAMKEMKDNACLKEKRFKFWLWIIVASMFILRILLALPAFLETEMLTRPDSGGYYQPALALLHDGVYHESPDSAAPATLRPAGYPFLLYLCFLVFGDSLASAGILGCLLSALTCYPVGLCGRILGGRKAGIAAALLFGLSLTSVAVAPLILTDTPLGFFCAWTLYFILKAWKSRELKDYIPAIIFAALGALFKPVNYPFFILAIPLLALILFGFRKKTVYALLMTAFFFLLILFPFMYRNYKIGTGFSVDGNSGELYFHNGSAILAMATGRNSEVILERMKQEMDEFFESHPEDFQTENQKIQFKLQQYAKLMKQYPKETLLTHIPQPYMLLPDLPTFLENNKLSTHGRGTLGVLREKGLFAALDYYLDGRFHLILLPLPLILASCITYLLSVYTVLLWLKKWKWKLLLIFGATALYYLFVPGPVTAPRFQIPALPMLCAMSGFAIAFLWHKFKSWKIGRAMKIKKGG